MPPLSDAAAKHLRRIRYRPNLPEWWPLLQVGLGVLIVLVLGFAFINDITDDNARPSDTTTQEDTTPTSEPGGTAPATSEPVTTAAPDTTAAPTTGAPATNPPVTQPAGDTVDLPGPGGIQYTVPVAARDAAVATAVATAPQAVVRDTTVVAASPDRVVFSFQIDLDGDGPLAALRTSVAVVLTDTGWVPSS